MRHTVLRVAVGKKIKQESVGNTKRWLEMGNRNGLYFDEKGKPKMFLLEEEKGKYKFLKFSELDKESRKYLNEKKTIQQPDYPVEHLLGDFLKMYLTNFHNLDVNDRDEFIKEQLGEDFHPLKLFCIKNKLIDGFGITDKGLAVLGVLENKDIQKKQAETNVLMLGAILITTALSLSAFFTKEIIAMLVIVIISGLVFFRKRLLS